MLVYKDGITRTIAETEKTKFLAAGFTIVEEKQEAEEKAVETVKKKVKKGE